MTTETGTPAAAAAAPSTVLGAEAIKDGEVSRDTAAADAAKTNTEQTVNETPDAAAAAAAKAAEDAAKAKETEGKAKAVGAPEKYEDFKFPEGTEPDAKALDEFRVAAKEMNLSQDQAQRLIDFQTKLALQSAKEQTEAWDKQLADWEKEARADPDIGGTKFDASVADARIAIDKLGSKGLREAMNAFGVGNNVHFIKFFAKVGRLVAEDKLDLGGGDPGPKKDLAGRMYPSMTR